MLDIFKKGKQEKLGLDLQNPYNQKVAIQASIDNKVPLISKGNGLYFVDVKHVKSAKLYAFLKQFIAEAYNCKQAVIDKEDPKCDYILIYDVKEEN